MTNSATPRMSPLHDGQSLLIRNGQRQEAFSTRGIATLLRMVSEGSPLLQGATVVDKVVGKAAAALMVLGGVKHCHAMLISEAATALFDSCGTDYGCDERTDHILNQTRTGWCPMELACRECATPEECLQAINMTLQEMRKDSAREEADTGRKNQ